MMKKLFVSLAILAITSVSFAQPISDRAVVPVAVSLNQILRLQILYGGNVEFVFADLNDYKTGIAGTRFTTRFSVASSTDWDLRMYASSASFVGNNTGSEINLSWVGYSISNAGAYTFGLAANLTASAGSQAAVVPIDDDANTAKIACLSAGSCAGDGTDNQFEIFWRAGTGEGTMIQSSFISNDQSINPDRYYTNIYFDLLTSGL